MGQSVYKLFKLIKPIHSTSRPGIQRKGNTSTKFINGQHIFLTQIINVKALTGICIMRQGRLSVNRPRI